MKKLLVVCAVFIFSQANAQSTNTMPVADQNPNYLQSQQHYMLIKDSLLQNFNTTVQQTYQAYDWYQEKRARKQARINNRQQVRLAYANNSFGFQSFNHWNQFGYNGFTPFFQQPNCFLPQIGYRSRNWCFWF